MLPCCDLQLIKGKHNARRGTPSSAHRETITTLELPSHRHPYEHLVRRTKSGARILWAARFGLVQVLRTSDDELRS